eukprot:Sdes_comp20172_c0_seq12m13377
MNVKSLENIVENCSFFGQVPKCLSLAFMRIFPSRIQDISRFFLQKSDSFPHLTDFDWNAKLSVSDAHSFQTMHSHVEILFKMNSSHQTPSNQSFTLSLSKEDLDRLITQMEDATD